MRKVGDDEFLVLWEDGHRSLYRNDYLRFQCPCAGCLDEWTGKRLITQERIAPAVKILETIPTGHYAVRFRWSDGHQTGIYSFEMLRKICPCPRCQEKKDSALPSPKRRCMGFTLT